MNYTNQYANQQFLYIAQTGKRLLGVIGGVDETTVQIEKQITHILFLLLHMKLLMVKKVRGMIILMN